MIKLKGAFNIEPMGSRKDVPRFELVLKNTMRGENPVGKIAQLETRYNLYCSAWPRLG
jgi:hypothetical protein